MRGDGQTLAIRDVRGADVATTTTVVVASRRDLAERSLLGRRVPVIIDHAFWNNVPPHVAALVRELAHGCNIVAGYRPEASGNHVVKVRGVGRVSDEPRALLVLLTEQPTDDELRSLHEFLREWKP